MRIAECFTDGNHRFWFDGDPVAQIATDGTLYYVSVLTRDRKVTGNVLGNFPNYPTSNEIKKLWLSHIS